MANMCFRPSQLSQTLLFPTSTKKLLLLVAAAGCFVSSSIPSFAQWTTVSGGINYSAGKVGINNTAPHGLLQFNTSHANRKIVLFESVDNDHQYYGLGTNADIFRFQIPGSTRAFRFYRADGATSSTEIFTILGTGNVGIGTSNPGSFKLAVEGKIGANEVQVRTAGSGWADYVFLDSYKLRPLSEVEKYVKENHHLPEVPSAAQVEKNGPNLGEMDAILLKKVEELYLIEQNKQLMEVKRENEALMDELNKLKK